MTKRMSGVGQFLGRSARSGRFKAVKRGDVIRVVEVKRALGTKVIRREVVDAIVGKLAAKGLIQRAAFEAETKRQRVLGILAGKVSLPADFLAPLNEDEMRLWEGE